jgi:hypothetical protein
MACPATASAFAETSSGAAGALLDTATRCLLSPGGVFVTMWLK